MIIYNRYDKFSNLIKLLLCMACEHPKINLYAIDFTKLDFFFKFKDFF